MHTTPHDIARQHIERDYQRRLAAVTSETEQLALIDERQASLTALAYTTRRLAHDTK